MVCSVKIKNIIIKRKIYKIRMRFFDSAKNTRAEMNEKDSSLTLLMTADPARGKGPVMKKMGKLLLKNCM